MRGKRRLTQFSLPLTIFKEGRYFIAHTPLLNLSVQGKTEEETRKRFAEAVVLFFKELEDMGTTDEVLLPALAPSLPTSSKPILRPWVSVSRIF